MTLTDFSLAQERIAARRRARENAAQVSASPSIQTELRHLPTRERIRGAGLKTWQSIRGREGTRPAFRVGQVDAELLDEELLELLKGQVGEGLKLFGVSHLEIPSIGKRADDLSRHISGMIGPLRSYLCYARCCSKSAYGITTRHMGPHCKT